MLAVERQKRILEIIQERQFAKVEALSKELCVSEMTIRRDLEKCEKEGLLQRCYGGATLKKAIQQEVHYGQKTGKNQEAKEELGRAASKYVKSGDTIFLDAGTTVFELAKQIMYIPDLTVVTNDLLIANLLYSQPNISLIMIGGTVQSQLGSSHGFLAEEMMKRIRVDTSFSSCLAVDDKFDLYSRDERKASFRRLLLENSTSSYLLVDKTKFFKTSLCYVHGLNVYTEVITDKHLVSEELQFAKQKGVTFSFV